MIPMSHTDIRFVDFTIIGVMVHMFFGTLVGARIRLYLVFKCHSMTLLLLLFGLYEKLIDDDVRRLIVGLDPMC